MPRDQLHELARDVHRLLDAGAASAAADTGLRRRLQVIKPLGAQVPALAAVAEAVERAQAAPANRAGAALSDLLLLVRQVQAGLARSGRDGNLVPVDPSGPWQTAAGKLHLDTWAAASFLPWANDTAELKTAVARPDFPDLRLVDPLLDKLTKTNASPKNDFLTDTVLPRYGPALAPDLVRGINLKGSASHARRLRALGYIDPAGATVLARQAVAAGSTAVRPEALRHLARHEPALAEDVAVGWLQTENHADLLVAAAAAVERTTRDDALDALLEVLSHRKHQAATAVCRALGRCPHPRTTPRLLETLQTGLDRIAALPARSSSKSAKAAPAKSGKAGKKAAAEPDPAQQRQELTTQAVWLLNILGHRRDAAAVPRLVELLDNAQADIREAAAAALEKIGDRKGLEAAAALVGKKHGGQAALRAAWRLPAKARYDLLAPLCEDLVGHTKPKEGQGKFILDLFEQEFTSTQDNDDEDEAPEPQSAPAKPAPRTDWDPRWAPLLRKLLGGPYRAEAGLGLAVVLGPKAVPDLLKVLEPSIKKNECGIAEALGYLRARSAIDRLIPLLPGQPCHHYCIHDALRHINDPAALAPLRDLLAKTKDNYRRSNLARLIDDLEKSTATAPA